MTKQCWKILCEKKSKNSAFILEKNCLKEVPFFLNLTTEFFQTGRLMFFLICDIVKKNFYQRGKKKKSDHFC